MNIALLRDFTSARVGLGRAGDSLPTHELLDFQLAHARARDAVHASLNSHSIALELKHLGHECLIIHSAAPDRATYLRRPDLGRILDQQSSFAVTAALAAPEKTWDAAFVIADGLSALAVHRHAAALLGILLPLLDDKNWTIAPIVVVEQGRVAIGDPIGYILRAALVVVLIGERPGLSSPDSLGVYLTWRPHPGRTDAERNCISNIRAEGLSYAAAAHKLLFLMTESRRRKLSGVGLKEQAGLLGA